MKEKNIGIVIKPWKAIYNDPIVLSIGDEVTTGRIDPEWPGWIWCCSKNGKQGWVPEKYLKMIAPEQALALGDYNAGELNADTGDELIVHLMESGWYYCTSTAGIMGWIPVENVKIKTG